MTTRTLPQLNHPQMRQIIARAVNWLKNAQKPDGQFHYEYLPFMNTDTQNNNMVRQAGALYALGEVAKRDEQNNYELEPYIRRSIAYFESLSLHSSHQGRQFRAVSQGVGKRDCQLGTTSLALCGILAAAERYPELAATYSDLIHDYKEFIIAMKIDGAGFRDTFRAGAEQQSDKESSYFNGEAMLALARYHRYASAHDLLNADEPSARITTDMFSYIDSPAAPFDNALYLWVMAAIRDVTVYDSEHAAAHADYALRYTQWRIDSVHNKKASKHNLSSVAEGMTSAYALLQTKLSDTDLQPIATEVDFWLTHTALTQLNASHPKLAPHIRNPQRADGGFLTGLQEHTQRIDFTQHALLSFMQKLHDIDGQPL